jgi:hypothetical protein
LSLRSLRLDPPGAATQTRLGAVCVEADLPWQRRACVPAARWRELFVAVQHLQVAESAGDEVVLRHAGPDPYLVGDVASAALVQAARGPRRMEVFLLLVAWGLLYLACRRLRPGRVALAAAGAAGLAAALTWSLPAWPASVWLEAKGDAVGGWDLFFYAPDEPDPQLAQRAEPGSAAADGWRRVSFVMPARRALALRIDPPEASAPVALRRLCLSTLGVLPARCLDAAAFARAFPHHHDLDLIASADVIDVVPAGLDPYLWSDFGNHELLAPLRITAGQAAAAGLLAAALVLAFASAGRARLRGWGRGALIVLHFTVVPVLGLEALLWFADPWLPGVWSLYDPDMGFRARPDASRANSLGFPDREYSFDRAPGTYRVLVLGDSFGWVGRGRWNYTDLLEDSLARRLGPGRVEVVNAGFPAIGPVQQRVVWRKWGQRYRPDLVLLASYLGNDIVDSDPRTLRLFVGDQPVERDSGDPPLVLFGRPLLPVSRLALAVRGRYRLWGPIADEPEAGPFLLDHAQYLAAERSLVRPWCRPLQQQYAAALSGYDAAVRGLAADVREQGIAFGLLGLPAAWSADSRRAEPLLTTFGAPREAFDLAAPHARLAGLAAQLQAPWLDLLPTFASAAAGGDELYLVDDSHWNRAGNARAATAIEPWLLEHWPPATAAR